MDQSLASITVLVVDDDASIRNILTRVLEARGASVTAVETAQEALALIQTVRPDLLLSDLQMPERDGYWLISEVRALPSERGGMTPAACLTGHAAPEDRTQILKAGYDYHIEKPFRIEALVGIVRILALKP